MDPIRETRSAQEPGQDTSPKSVERSLFFMLLLAVATGVVAGVGAWGFRMLIGLVHNVMFLGEFSCIRPIEAACLTSTLRAKTRA